MTATEMAPIKADDGRIPASASFVIWLRHEVCSGYITENHRRFFLTPDQAERWKALRADLS